MKLAIIIPAYNSDKYIIDCYNSVKNQLPFPGIEYEIRIGVDGCPKTSAALRGINHYYSYNNVGAYVMRNSLMALDPADYFCYFDSDDVMKSDFLLSCMNKIIDGENIVMPAKIQCNEKLQPIKSQPVIEAGGAMVFKNSVLQAVGGFHEYRCACDTDFMRRVEMAGFKIYEINQGLYKRRLHKQSLTKSGLTAFGGPYRREVWQKMTADRKNGIIKIKPRITELEKR